MRIRLSWRILLALAMTTNVLFLVQLFSIYLHRQTPELEKLTSSSQLGHKMDNGTKTSTTAEPLNPPAEVTVENEGLSQRKEGDKIRVKNKSTEPGDQNKVTLKGPQEEVTVENEGVSKQNEGREVRVKNKARAPVDQNKENKVTVNAKVKVKVTNEKFLVDTPTCTIPKTKIMTNYYKKLYFYSNTTIRRPQHTPDCSDEVKLSRLIDNDRLLEMNSKYFPSMSCSLKEAVRMDRNDNNFSVIDHGPIQEPLVDVTSMELLMTVCDNVFGNRTFINYDARLPLKPSVLKKMKFWENEFQKMNGNKPKKSKKNGEGLEKMKDWVKEFKKMEKKKQKANKRDETKNNPDSDPFPINVLIIGYDSISRSHFHRSLPKTVRRLTEDLNFIDFKGFHSILAYTVYNLGPLLHGDGVCNYGCDEENSEECLESWYDSCPMIWKEFNRRNYVTLFLEDREQSFNYEGMEGFKARPPTDYYPHPLFVAHIADSLQGKSKPDCMSTETSPQFHLRYLSRFLQQFKDTPFFSLLFNAYPFHDNVEALADVDEDLDNFILKNLQENPELLEKTLIIVMGDHGERYGHYYTYSLEAYLEKVLPGLFIRIPEVLKRRYPDIDFDGNLEKNTRQLLTVRDLHHTLLHTLILSSTRSGEKEELLQTDSDLPVQLREFTESKSDRGSLLTQVVPSNRSCVTVGIDAGTCVCNSTRVEEIQSVDNPYLLQTLTIFALEELNAAIANSSRFGDKCREWERKMDTKPSATLIKQSSSYREVLFQFLTEADWEKSGLTDAPGTFQVKLRIHKVNRKKRKGKDQEEEEEIGGAADEEAGPIQAKLKNVRLERISDFFRMDKYGLQSWCIDPVETRHDKLMRGMCVCHYMKEDVHDQVVKSNEQS